MRGCFRVFSLGIDVPGVFACPKGSVGRCLSIADASLSLSLSLSCPTSTPRLTGQNGRFSTPLAGYGTPRPNASCSKLPSHAHGDIRSPREVARDRNSAYTHANVRQAHRQWTSHAPGGVAGSPRTPLSRCHLPSHAPGGVAGSPRTPLSRCHLPSHALGGVADQPSAYFSHRDRTFRAPGGVAGQPSAYFFLRDLSSHAPGGVAVPHRTHLSNRERTSHAPKRAPGSPRALSVSPVQRVCSNVAATTLIVAPVFEEAPVRTPIRTGSDIERRGLNPRPRRSQTFRAVCRAR